MKAVLLSKASKNCGSAQSKKTLQERELTHSLVFMFVLALALFSPYAQAQSLTVLYEFTGSPDGAGSYARLVQDSTGNLYGTTPIGGTNNGTVFEVSSQGTETLLHTFSGKRDGFGPGAGLVIDASGNLYGTTTYGGTHNFGTVFKLNKAGKKTVLYNFSGAPDGANPWTDLVRDAAGNLYGTTTAGGSGNCNGGSGCGTVFMVSANGTEKVVHSFAGGVADGQTPFAGLLRDAAGNLYGTTYGGGTAGYGTVFELSATGMETILHNFAGYPTDGQSPEAVLVRDAAGNLYGTTLEGGAHAYGTVFKLSKTGKEKLLYSFGTGTDGKNPAAGLVRDTAGNLYGTTQAGGGTGCNGNGCGTVFELTKARVEKVLYSFDTANAGAVPFAALILDAAGDLYGTTSNGGAGFGTVFKITP
jgi:uncharacterized repeat protein (TIGR03803 family)